MPKLKRRDPITGEKIDILHVLQMQMQHSEGPAAFLATYFIPLQLGHDLEDSAATAKYIT